MLTFLFFGCSANKKNSTIFAQNFYNFSATDMKGAEISMEQFKGKIVLVVNTASKCGFTPQFEGLEQLYQKYKDDGLVVLGFPCNQFGSQDPGTNEEIQEFCQLNYGVTFPMFAKIDVNGENAHPLYQFLKESLPGSPGTAIKWNFTKFLISADGTPLKRYGSNIKPKNLEKDIERELK